MVCAMCIIKPQKPLDLHQFVRQVTETLNPHQPDGSDAHPLTKTHHRYYRDLFAYLKEKKEPFQIVDVRKGASYVSTQPPALRDALSSCDAMSHQLVAAMSLSSVQRHNTLQLRCRSSACHATSQ
jgi:hypothetical protein